MLCAKLCQGHPQLDLPPENGRFRKLTSLKRSTSSISPSIWRLSALRHLTLDQSSPSAADMRNVSCLQRLRSLRLTHSGGALHTALGSLFAPSGLKSLILDGNDMPSVPELGWLKQHGSGPQVQ